MSCHLILSDGDGGVQKLKHSKISEMKSYFNTNGLIEKFQLSFHLSQRKHVRMFSPNSLCLP